MDVTNTLEVQWIAIEKVHLNSGNPRLNDEAVPHVAASLRRFGWRQPIVARPSGEIVAGNTRLKAALSLGMTEVPVVTFEGDDLEATAFSIADNRVGEIATWDGPALVELLEQLRVEDALEGVGYSGPDIDALLAEIQAQQEVNAQEDEVPEPPDEATTRPGDIWLLGDHRLHCGDSGSPEALDRLLDGAPIHLVNTDPPYNVKVEPRSNNAIAAGLSSFGDRRPGKASGGSRKLRARDRPLENDYVSDEDFRGMLRAWFANTARVLEPGRAFYIWGGYANCANYPAALSESGLYFSQAVIWVKEHPVLTRKDFMGNHEWCFYGWREGAAHQYLGPHNAPDVWSVKKINPNAMVHLTEKPVELAARAIQYSSRPGENVLDLFGGSGSTLIACEQAGRHAHLMELDCLYCDVIVDRWQKFTGRTATHAETERSFHETKEERAEQ